MTPEKPKPSPLRPPVGALPLFKRPTSGRGHLRFSCLQCDWSVEAVNTSTELSSAFLEAAYPHVDQHEQHALEVVQRLRVYSENYVEPTPTTQPRRSDLRRPTSLDACIQTGFMDKTRAGPIRLRRLRVDRQQHPRSSRPPSNSTSYSCSINRPSERKCHAYKAV